MPYKDNEIQKAYFKKYNEKYYPQNKEHISKVHKRWREKNPEYNKEYFQNHFEEIKIQRKKYILTPKGKFANWERAIKERGFVSEITLDEFSEITNKPCYYCGGDGFGIDRLNSSLGYFKGNIVSCCSMCNYMKQSYSEEDFVNQCVKITNNILGKIIIE